MLLCVSMCLVVSVSAVDWVVAVSAVAGGVLLMVVVILRGAKGSASSGDMLIVVTPEGLTYSVNVTPLVPPNLYTYSCPGTEMCLMVARNPPLLLYDSKAKRTRKLWIGVEVDGLAMTVSPEEAHIISSVSDAVGEYNIDDVVRLAKLAIDKKAFDESVVLPGGFRVTFTYKVYPTVIKVLTDILRADSVALANILSALRAAREAKTLAEAVAIRKGAEFSKWMYLGIFILMAAIAVAIIMFMRR